MKKLAALVIVVCGITVGGGWATPFSILAQTTPLLPVDTYLPITINVEAPATETPIPPTATPTATQMATPTETLTVTPTATPTSTESPFEFNVAIVQSCLPQAGGTWFDGKTYKNGEPTNGYRVVFSYEADGPHVTQPAISGPHEGYLGWDTGYYSHIIAAARPRAGDWFVWIIDENGERISELANFTSDGDANTCNQAVVDFDSQ